MTTTKTDTAPVEKLKKIRCIIADDDPASRLIIQHYVGLEPDMVLEGVFSSGEEALDFLKANPQVLVAFLDIQMPGLSGMELLRSLPESNGLKAILITTSTDFAVDAFDLDVVDYVVKPLFRDRFQVALEKLRRNISGDSNSGKKVSREIFFKTGTKFIRLHMEDIAYVEALSDYVLLVTTDGTKHVVHSTMKSMDEKLESLGFIRIHRSYIINTNRIDSVAGHQAIVAGKKIPISKSYQEQFYKLLKNEN